MITQERLKELLHYDPDTGVFLYIKSRHRIIAGTIAGHKGRHGHLHLQIDRKKYQCHRLAFLYMTGHFPKHGTDHINGVKDDNRWVNLRDATYKENNRNAKIRSDNSSGFGGVCWHKRSKKWMASIRDDGKNIYLGSYLSKSDAITARKAASKKYGYHENHGRRV